MFMIILLQFVSDYDSQWGFGIIERNEQLYKQLWGLLDECENLYVATVEQWYDSRESQFKNDKKLLSEINSFYENIYKDLV